TLCHWCPKDHLAVEPFGRCVPAPLQASARGVHLLPRFAGLAASQRAPKAASAASPPAIPALSALSTIHVEKTAKVTAKTAPSRRAKRSDKVRMSEGLNGGARPV